jgi:hypothetical protein
MSKLDDLNNALTAISTDVDNILTQVATLEQQLTDANNNPNVDLSAPLATCAAIRSKLEGASTTASSATTGS